MCGVSIRFAVQASPLDRASWLKVARDAEVAGFHRLYVADHPGSSPSPFVALAAAAAVTERVQLGTCVVNAGVWDPLDLASAVATLDVVSGGRAILGVGAGHTPQEWTSRGLPHPAPGDRVGRLAEVVECVQALLAGEQVTHLGDHVTLLDASLDAPRPVQDRIPVLVGGSGRRVLGLAAQRADIVGIAGLGRTLEDGHRHEIDWSPEAVEATLEHIGTTAAAAGRSVEVEALVQVIEITPDAATARDAAEAIAETVPGATAADLLTAPYAWIGTLDDIRQKLHRMAELGISSYVVREAAMEGVRRVVAPPPRAGRRRRR